MTKTIAMKYANNVFIIVSLNLNVHKPKLPAAGQTRASSVSEGATKHLVGKCRTPSTWVGITEEF